MDKVKKVAQLEVITIETIRSVYKLPAYVTKVKLIGSSVKEIASKVQDENISYSGRK